MRKLILHKEVIKKQAEKRMFQIRLPHSILGVTGIMVTGISKGKRAVSTEIYLGKKYAGLLRLTIPEKRDVFYTASVPYSNHLIRTYEVAPLLKLGLASESSKWFQNPKEAFLKVNVPLCCTVIEGYYEDQSFTEEYELNIYLEARLRNR